MRSLGLFGTTVPQAYGGLGVDLVTHARIMEELARGWLSMAGVINPNALCTTLVLHAGSDAQRETLLEDLATGRRRERSHLPNRRPVPMSRPSPLERCRSRTGRGRCTDASVGSRTGWGQP